MKFTFGILLRFTIFFILTLSFLFAAKQAIIKSELEDMPPMPASWKADMSPVYKKIVSIANATRNSDADLRPPIVIVHKKVCSFSGKDARLFQRFCLVIYNI
jgi:hypothetical protein